MDNINSIAIHQPNYFPWVGYFIKAHLSHSFVFHEDVDLNMRSYTRRCSIRKTTATGLDSQFLSIPISSKTPIKIKDCVVNNEIPWRINHINIIKKEYQKSPYYNSLMPVIEQMITQTTSSKNLASINISILTTLFKLLSINPIFLTSSSLNLTKKGHYLNLAILESLKANKYYSGIGSKVYQKEEDFLKRGIALEYVFSYDYLNKNPYSTPQIKGLSIIDALFYLGVSGTKSLILNFSK